MQVWAGTHNKNNTYAYKQFIYIVTFYLSTHNFSTCKQTNPIITGLSINSVIGRLQKRTSNKIKTIRTSKPTTLPAQTYVVWGCARITFIDTLFNLYYILSFSIHTYIHPHIGTHTHTYFTYMNYDCACYFFLTFFFSFYFTSFIQYVYVHIHARTFYVLYFKPIH